MHQPIQTHRKWWCEPHGFVLLRYMSFPEYMCAVALTLHTNTRCSGPNPWDHFIFLGLLGDYLQHARTHNGSLGFSGNNTEIETCRTFRAPSWNFGLYILLPFYLQCTKTSKLLLLTAHQNFYNCGTCWQLLQFMVEWLNKKAFMCHPTWFF